jgi:hypothetical protein
MKYDNAEAINMRSKRKQNVCKKKASIKRLEKLRRKSAKVGVIQSGEIAEISLHIILTDVE